MNLPTSFSAWLRRSGWLLLLIALVQFLLHIWVGAHDHFFRDEMYYLAAARHVDLGYVDHPPFVALVAWLARMLFGDSLVGVRLFPALAGVLIILLTGDMVALLGGGLAAQVLAAIAIAVNPAFLGSSGLLTMDPFDQLWWTLCAWTLVRLIRGQQPRLWLVFGLFAGLGLQNKLTMGLYAGALVLGMLLSNQRKLLFNRWLIFGGLIALVTISSYIIWNVMHGFPTLEFTQAYASGKTYQVTPLEFLWFQVLQENPLLMPLWLGGLYLLFFTQSGRPYRSLGWAYLFLFIFFMLQKAKFYWLSSAYPPVFASGAYGLELLVNQRPRLKWLQPGYIWVAVISGLLLIPFSIPILSPDAFIRLNAALGNAAGIVKQENLATAELPQNYADRHGWYEMVDQVKAAYDTLTPQEQAEACIYTYNYGEAAAVDLYGPTFGLPKAVSGHNSYFIWGPQGCSGKVLITVNVDPADLVTVFESVKAMGVTRCTYCLPFENGIPIAIARGMKYDMEQVWPTVKHFE
jgi:4-amino-4-deoxy-L-arabinose transferase-like glycosyltransferase